MRRPSLSIFAKSCLILGVVFSLSLISSSHSAAVSPSDWRAGNIIDDVVFTGKDDLTVSQIQDFLNSKVPTCDTWGAKGPYYDKHGNRWNTRADFGRAVGSPPPYTCMKEYWEVPKTSPGNYVPASNYGGGAIPAGAKSTAEIIWQAAQDFNISPRVLLVTLQKESGLVTDDWPFKSQLTYAMGAHCPDTGPGGSANCDVNYSGFSFQMREAADLFRSYLDNMQQPWWKSTKRPYQSVYIAYDVEDSCGGSSIYLENKATTALYTYTPYQPNQAALNAGYKSAEPCGAYGNRNFWLYFNDWFGSTRSVYPFAWEYVNQSAYSDSDRLRPFTSIPTVKPGETVYLQLKAKNTGYQNWQNSNMRLGTTRPMDVPSQYATNNWITGARATSLLEETVLPGQVGTFNFEMKMPSTSGTYKQYFNLLVEGREWLNDPGLQYSVNVVSTHSGSLHNRTVLPPGTILRGDEYLLSADGQSVLALNGSQGLSMYSNFRRIWGPGAANQPGAWLVMQTDGNLVLYSSSNVALWASGTDGNPGARLALQPDGNLVIYNTENTALWASYTIHNPDHFSYINNEWRTPGFLYPFQSLDTANGTRSLLLQPDGNLVLYDANRKPLWASNTAGKDPKYLALQSDGNLVLYSKSNVAIWNSGTPIGGNSQLLLQDDGNLVLYNRDYRALWATYTNR